MSTGFAVYCFNN